MLFKNLKQFLVDSARVAISGFDQVSPEQEAARTKVCDGCEHLNGERCGVCNCYLPVKRKFTAERCPMGKWPGESGYTLEQPYVTGGVRAHRMAICETCPQRRGRQCAKCSCDLTTYTRLTVSKCPLNKW